PVWLKRFGPEASFVPSLSDVFNMACMQSEKKHVSRWKDQGKKGQGGPNKLSHKELLAKWTRDGSKFGPPKKVWTSADRDRNRQSCGRFKEDEARPDAGVIEEEDETNDMLFKASDLAHARMAELAEEMQIQALQGPDDAGDGGEADDVDTCAGASPEELQTLVDCRRSQLEELEMLEAMFPDEFRPLYASTGVDELRASLEAKGAEALRSVAAHPPLELLLQMTVPDERSPDETGGKQLIAFILLHIVFPPMYPTPGTPPEFHFEDVMIADANDEIGLDKVLWPEVNFDVNLLITEMQQMAADIQPDPCVHAIVSWMSENVFSHAQ
ncbi:unnamed protein product, partial [Polarella glacialis]